VLRAAWLLGLTDADTSARARSIAPVGGSRLGAGRALGEGELQALSRACGEETARSAQRGALLALLAGGGLRVSEALSLRLEHVEEGAAGRTLRVLGKGNRERAVPIGPGVAAQLDRWLRYRGTAPGFLLCPLHRSGAVIFRAWSKRAATEALVSLGQTAGVPLTTHDFRRTHITGLLAAGEDVLAVSRRVGHVNVNTTSRYDRRGDEAARKLAVTGDRTPWRPDATEPRLPYFVA